MSGSESSEQIVREFQRRVQVFRGHWTRNFAMLVLPGFLLFIAGILTDTRGVMLAGIAVLVVAWARGLHIVWKYRRCPACNSVQLPAMRFPHDWCRSCGVRLSGEPAD